MMEVQGPDFFFKVWRILKRFWLALLLSFLAILMMTILESSLVSLEWRIPGNGNGNAWASILPLALVSGCHFLLPFVLDPRFIYSLTNFPLRDDLLAFFKETYLYRWICN